MRILFVTKNFIIEPLGIMYLMSALENSGHKTDIVQADEEDVEACIGKFKPHIIAFSVITGNHAYFQNINFELKKRYSYLALFGGPHATFFPEEVMKDSAVDIVCLGEGEEAIVELANALKAKKSYSNIKNLWVRQSGEIYKNEVRPLQALDSIDFPARKIIYDKYESSRQNPIKNIITTRGCPFNCPYCYNHLIKKIYTGKGAYVRQRSVGNVIAEMLEIKKYYPVKMFYFQDDIFTINKEWLKNFSDQYKKTIALPFHCHLRVNMTDHQVIDLLSMAGCASVSFAIETGNDEIRTKILGRSMAKEQIFEVAEMLRKAKIRFRIFNMIGIPGGSIKIDLETLKLNIQCRPDLGWASIYQPYPKTELYEIAKKMNLCKEIKLDEFNNFFDKSVLDIPDKQQLLNLQRLFSFVVSWPILMPLIEILIRLPLNSLYSKINDFWKNHCNNRIYATHTNKYL